GQRNVIDALPGSPGYSDLWHVMKVVVDTSYVANSLKDARSILAARDAGQLTIDPTMIYVNCPVVRSEEHTSELQSRGPVTCLPQRAVHPFPTRRSSDLRAAECDRRAPRLARLQRPLARDEGRRRHVLRREQPEGCPLHPRGARRGPTHDRSDDDLRELSRGELSHDTLFSRSFRTARDPP